MRNYLYLLATDKKKGFIASAFKFLLYLLSLIYGLIVKILAFYYRIRAYKLNCKVISIGNITLGGTGKTPFVQILAEYLYERGHRIAIISRGYKRKTRDDELSTMSYQTMGDEAYLLSKNLPLIPVLVGRDRINKAKKALEKYNVDTIILDDGFQHWRLFRDLDIVLINAKNTFGNNHLIPRGILREPISSLKRADIIVLTKLDLKEESLSLILGRIKKINPKAGIFKAIYQPQNFLDISKNRYPLSFIKDKEICLVCGIADPDSFESALNNLGARLILKFIFFDHYVYEKEGIERIIDSCIKKNIKIIVTTEKDNMRLEGFHKILQSYLFILRSEIKIIDREDDFFKRTDSLYHC